MTNTTTTAEELAMRTAMRTMIAELKIMNLKLDMLENDIDEKLDKWTREDECFKIEKIAKIYGGSFIKRMEELKWIKKMKNNYTVL